MNKFRNMLQSKFAIFFDRMPGRVNGHQQDDDCLSYSSTEHDVSMHEIALNGSAAPVNVTAPLNMSFNNGKCLIYLSAICILIFFTR